MKTRLIVSLAAMFTLALVCASCGYTIRVERNYPSPYSLNGVHKVAPIERTVFRGTYLWADEHHELKLLAVRMIDRMHYGPDTCAVLSERITTDEFGNYVVEFKGNYPTTLIPRFAFQRVIVPVYVYTSNTVNTTVAIERKERKLGQFMVPACSGQLMLLPTSGTEGFNLRFFKRKGGGVEHFEVPDPGGGPVIAMNGYPVVREILVASWVERECTIHRPQW